MWPIGGGGHFLKRLSLADKEAVDHNQEIWEGWLSLVPSKSFGIREVYSSSNLKAYGRLWGLYHEGFNENGQSVTFLTDRELQEVGKRTAEALENTLFVNEERFMDKYIISTHARRLIFMYPPLFQVVNDRVVIRDRRYLAEYRKGKEYLTAKRYVPGDGHDYVTVSEDGVDDYNGEGVQEGETLYRSNYPAILMKYF